MADAVTCPECGETARRDRRFLKDGRTPFICKAADGGCGAWMVDDAEPRQSEKGTVRLRSVPTGQEDTDDDVGT